MTEQEIQKLIADHTALRNDYTELSAKYATLQEEFALMQQQMDWLRKQLFGRKTEQTCLCWMPFSHGLKPYTSRAAVNYPKL